MFQIRPCVLPTYGGLINLPRPDLSYCMLTDTPYMASYPVDQSPSVITLHGQRPLGEFHTVILWYTSTFSITTFPLSISITSPPLPRFMIHSLDTQTQTTDTDNRHRQQTQTHVVYSKQHDVRMDSSSQKVAIVTGSTVRIPPQPKPWMLSSHPLDLPYLSHISLNHHRHHPIP
jgi:hypothetical protein